MAASIREYLQPWASWRRKRFWLLVILAILILSGFFAVPRIVERALVQAVEKTGRTIGIADIRSNPFHLSLTITGLEIRDSDGTTLTRFDELYTNFQLSSVFYRAMTFADIRLLGLHVEEERLSEDQTRWRRFVKDLSPPQSAEPTNETGDPPRVIIHNLVIEDGSIGITDQLADGLHTELGPVSVDVQDLRSIPDHSGMNEVTIHTSSGGVVSWKGDLQIVPLASSGHFSVRGKGLPAVLRYADYHLPIDIEGEHLEMDFDYQLEMTDQGLRLQGDNTVTRTGRIEARFDDSSEPFVSLESIDFQGGSWRFPEQTVNADSLAINGVELDVTLDENGVLNLFGVLPEAESSNQGNGEESLADWTVNVDELSITGSAFVFEDHRTESPANISVEGLDLRFRQANNTPGSAIPADISGRLSSGGSFTYNGDLTVLPSAGLQGIVAASDLELAVAQPWIAGIARVDLKQGTASVRADVQGTLPDALSINGSVEVNSLELRDTRRDERLAGLQSLDVERFEYNMAENSARTSAVHLNGAFGRVHIFEDLSTNIGDLLVNSREATQTEAETVGLNLSIAGIEIEDSSLDFTDDSLPLPFRALIGNLDGSVSTLATQTSEPTRIRLDGQVNEYGEASISGTLNPWDFTQNADIDMVLRNLEMSRLTPYTIQYAGYAIESGRLDMNLGYILQQRKLEGENSIVIRELELGDKVEHPDAVSLPLKLAVALLKDSEGVIDIDLPVSGDLDDPTFRISGIVWKAIGNLITKIVTSPFRLLGNLVGVDSEDFGTLRFEPGLADISPPDREQLLKLAQAMQERPELELTVTGVHNEELDRPALQALALVSQLDAARASLLESGQADVLAAERQALESLFVATFPETGLASVQDEFTRNEGDDGENAVFDEPAYIESLRTRLVDAQEIPESDLENLGSERARNIVALLTEQGDGLMKVNASADVEAGEAEEGEVVLELEVAVGEAE